MREASFILDSFTPLPEIHAISIPMMNGNFKSGILTGRKLPGGIGLWYTSEVPVSRNVVCLYICGGEDRNVNRIYAF